MAKYLALGILVIVLISGRAALADKGLAGFGHIAEPVAPGAEADPWGPVPTEKKSLANLAPVLLPFFNNGPVFGLPGTVVGDFWHRTQLTGDWGGVRTDLARRGVFVDLYSTSTYQAIPSGGLRTGSTFVQNTQLSINLDTGRLGLWPGGLFHFAVLSRYGSSPRNTFTAGSFVPQYAGLVLPGPLLSHDIYPSEFFLVQSFSPKFSVVLGKINNVFIPDQTLFGDSFKYYFANFNFNNNPMNPMIYRPTDLTALGVWAPTSWLTFAGGVLDPNTTSNTLAANAFNKVDLYLASIIHYQVGGLPGQISPAFNWTNKPKINLDSPFGPLSRAQIPQAVGVLLGSPLTDGLKINFNKGGGFVIGNFSQYLYVKDDPENIAGKLKSGQPLNGIGAFVRVGFAASWLIYGHYPWERRPVCPWAFRLPDL